MVLNTQHKQIIRKREVFKKAFKNYAHNVEACMRYIEIEMGVRFSSYPDFRSYVESAEIEFRTFDEMILKTGGLSPNDAHEGLEILPSANKT